MIPTPLWILIIIMKNRFELWIWKSLEIPYLIRIETILYRFIKLYIGQWTFWKIHTFIYIWWVILWVCIYDEKYSKTNVFYDVVSQLKNLYSSRTLWNLAAFLMWWYFLTIMKYQRPMDDFIKWYHIVFPQN